MKKYLVIALLVIATSLVAENNTKFDRFLQKYGIKRVGLVGFKTKTKHIAFFPALSYTSETNVMLGFGAVVDAPKSKTSIFAVYTLNKQTILKGEYKSEFNPKLKYEFKTGVKIYPEKFYGYGNLLDEEENEQKYTDKSVSFEPKLHYYFTKNFYVGAIADLAYHDIGEIESFGTTNINSLCTCKGLKAGKVLGFGGSINFDSRNDENSPSKGILFENSFLNFNKSISDYDFNKFTSNFTIFNKLPIGVWANKLFIEVNNGNNIPFYEHANSGGSKGLLGIKKGLSYDKCATYVLSEWRVNLNKTFDAVVNIGFGQAKPELKDFGKGKVNNSIGAGLRYMVFKKKGIKMRFDIAIGSNGDIGFTMGMGERF